MANIKSGRFYKCAYCGRETYKRPSEIIFFNFFDTNEILALINESIKEVNNRSLPYVLLLTSCERKNTAEEIFKRLPNIPDDLECGSIMEHDCNDQAIKMKKLTKKQLQTIQEIGEDAGIDNLGWTAKRMTIPDDKLSWIDNMILKQVCPECRTAVTVSCAKLKRLGKCKYNI